MPEVLMKLTPKEIKCLKWVYLQMLTLASKKKTMLNML